MKDEEKLPLSPQACSASPGVNWECAGPGSLSQRESSSVPPHCPHLPPSPSHTRAITVLLAMGSKRPAQRKRTLVTGACHLSQARLAVQQGMEGLRVHSLLQQVAARSRPAGELDAPTRPPREQLSGKSCHKRPLSSPSRITRSQRGREDWGGCHRMTSALGKAETLT